MGGYPYSETEITIARIQYQTGLPLAKIANELGRDPKGLYRLFKRLDIPVRSRSEALKQYYCNERYFETIDTEGKAYWLGFIMADGCIHVPSRGSPRLIIGLHKKDIDHLYRLKRSLQSSHKIQMRSDGAVVLTITSRKICEDLMSYGVVPRKSGREVFPAIIHEKLAHHFFRGYIDGDGSWSYRKHKRARNGRALSLSICGGPHVIENFSSWAQSITGRSSPKIRPSGLSSTIQYGGNILVPKLAMAIYQNAEIFLPRKLKTIERAIGKNLLLPKTKLVNIWFGFPISPVK